MKRKWKWETGGLGEIGFHVDEEFDSMYICSRKCFVRTVLLIKISKGSVIPQVLSKYNVYAAILKLICKIPTVYIHNFNRDLPEELVRKQLCWREVGNSQPYFITTISLWFFPLWEFDFQHLGEPLFFHCSMTTFLQGKQKLTNQKFAHVKPQKIFKRKILPHKCAYPYNNSCSTNPSHSKCNVTKSH